MFNKEDEYLEAIKDAQIYTSAVDKPSNIKWVIFNFLLVSFFAYATFSYLQKNTKVFASLSLLPVTKQAVLGVSETVDDAEFTNDKLMDILNDTEVDSIGDLQNSMKVLMNEPSIKSKSSYTEAIARELDDKSGFKGKIAVVKQGDKLSSIDVLKNN